MVMNITQQHTPPHTHQARLLSSVIILQLVLILVQRAFHLAANAVLPQCTMLTMQQVTVMELLGQFLTATASS